MPKVTMENKIKKWNGKTRKKLIKCVEKDMNKWFQQFKDTQDETEESIVTGSKGKDPQIGEFFVYIQWVM